MGLQESSKLNVAIVSPNKEAFSESFIKAHLELLPFQIHYYYGGYTPIYYKDKNLKLGGVYRKLLQFVGSRIFSTGESWHTHSIKRSFRLNRVRVVLCQYGTTGAQMWPICKDLKIPMIVHFHGFDASVNNVIDKYREAYIGMFRYATFVVSVSKEMSSKLLSLGCPKEKIIYNPYGPNDEFLTVQATYQSNTLVSLGRFVDKKAPYYTILSFHKALSKFPDMRLVMGGDGPLLNTCKNLVRFFGLESKVEFPGVLTRQQFIAYLKTSTAYIQHSIVANNGDMEGTPVAILEASAAGLPVIATYHAGVPDVVLDNETGLLVDEHDVTTMSEHIVKLMNDRRVAEMLGSAGRELIKSKFSMGRHIELLAQTIETAASN